MRLFLALVLGILVGFPALAQRGPVLTEEQLIELVRDNHPMSVQADLLRQQGLSTVLQARGGFDPKLGGTLDQKYFEDKSYYSLLNAGLKVPTWYGIEVKTGIDRNDGIFLNPEDNVPDAGLWFAGISVPLGQGLFIDQRRASLRQAQLFAESTEAGRQQMLNELYFSALGQYWKWVQTWNQFQVFNNAVNLAQFRFDAVKQSFELGDRPAIDTLEAFIQVQNRVLSRNEYQQVYRNETLKLSNFLWLPNSTPLVITDSLQPPNYEAIETPDAIPTDTLNTFIAELVETHPELQLYGFKLAGLGIEQRLKSENLKPVVNLQYNALSEPVGIDVVQNQQLQNYKWGAEVSFPLFLRKERGGLQLTKLKIQNTELDQRQKLLELQNKVRQYYNDQQVLEQQVALFQDNVNNYDRLLDGERQKFTAGESSLFLVNRRETSLLNAQVKLVEFITKYRMAQMGIRYAAGRIANSL